MARERASREPAQGGGTQTQDAPPAIVIQSAPAPSNGHSNGSRHEVDAFTMRLIGRYGSAESALTHLAGEQLKYRRRAQAAEDHAAGLQKQLPAAGAVVLTGDEAKAFQTLRTGNDKFSLVGLDAQLKELSDLKTKDAQQSRASTLRTAAGTTYREKVLARLVGDLPIEFKTVMQRKEDGQDGMEEVKVPYVKVGDTLMALDAWLEQEHKDFLDIVRVPEGEDAGESKETRGDRSSDSAVRGAIMPKQTASESRSAGDKAAKDILKTVDRTLSSYLSPSMRRKEAAGGK